MEKNKELRVFAEEIRVETIKELAHLGFGHVGGSMSVVETLAVLYGSQMNYDPKNPTMEQRDRLVMSKGHAGPALYATLALKGFFPLERLKTLNQNGTTLPSHCDRLKTPGVDMTTGSLGQGISMALGLALGAKMRGKDFTTYLILGDGEVAEGQVWEAMMAANKYHLDNLCACVDVNGLQIDGETKDVMPTEPLDKKFESFGWHVIKIDGHDFDQIEAAYKEAEQTKGQPTMILAKTIKGRGVSFMENNAGWHGKAPNDEQWAQAKAELEAQIKELEG